MECEKKDGSVFCLLSSLGCGGFGTIRDIRNVDHCEEWLRLPKLQFDAESSLISWPKLSDQ
jgi:hypothetical protein